MEIERQILEIQGTTGTDIHDLSGFVEEFLERAGIPNGTLIVMTPGSTAGVTTIEYEAGALSDLRRALEEIAPTHGNYEHNERWGDGNGYSHVRSAIMGPSISIPVADGRPILGTWQQIIVCDFDNRARSRKVVLQMMG
jgi:secondary thiamine-phosphate synthase enzyme